MGTNVDERAGVSSKASQSRIADASSKRFAGSPKRYTLPARIGIRTVGPLIARFVASSSVARY
jgi:hypothetical protein